MMAEDRKKCLVIGLGNPFRSDDGVGLVVAEELRRCALPDSVEVINGGMDELGLIELFSGADHVVIVDAVSMGEAPGTICVFSAEDGETLPPVRNLTTHTFGLADAVALSARLGISPRITVVGIQPQSAETGEGLSERVRSGIPGIVEAVMRVVLKTDSTRSGCPAPDKSRPTFRRR